MENLEDIRNKIDSIDREIVDCFVRRMALSKEIAIIKSENNACVLDKNRENTVLDNVTKAVPKALQSYVKELYQTILSASKEYQNTIIEKL